MELRDALDQIAEIRHRLAEAETFRGYRAISAALSGVVAVAAAVLQPLFIPAPVDDPIAYVVLWSVVAAVGLGSAALSMWLTERAARDARSQPLTRTGLAPLIPCLVAGVCVTLVLVRLAPETGWLLPGLWQIFFSQGMFAACRTLPRLVFVVPSFYLFSGLCTLWLARGEYALTPLAMALPFGLGQTLAAISLYCTLERHDHTEESCSEQ